MWERFCREMKLYGWDNPDTKILIAVSGGPDSVTLLDLLARFNKEGSSKSGSKGGPKLHVFHLNHKLRGEEGDKDADLVNDLSIKYEIPCTILNFNVALYARNKKLSFEQAGRNMRYHFLNRVAKVHSCSFIALGHTADDQAETFFMHLFRGAGGKGLKGMQPVRDLSIIRPLLSFTRRDMLSYCSERELSYRVDSTNYCTNIIRNKIRHELFPYLEKEFASSLRHTICRTMQIIRDEEAFLDKTTYDVFKILAKKEWGGIRFPRNEFLKFDVAIQRRLIQFAINKIAGSLEGMTFSNIEGIRRLLTRGRPGKCYIAGQVKAEYAHGFLSVWKQQRIGQEKLIVECVIPIPGRILLPRFRCQIETRVLETPNGDDNWHTKEGLLSQFNVALDYDKITKPVLVRNRCPGDRIAVLGVEGRKKLSDLFIDRKIPKNVREQIPVLETGGKIMWVAGIKPPAVNKDLMLTKGTRRVLYLTMMLNELENRMIWRTE